MRRVAGEVNGEEAVGVGDQRGRVHDHDAAPIHSPAISSSRAGVIRVAAVGVNFADTLPREGRYPVQAGFEKATALQVQEPTSAYMLERVDPAGRTVLVHPAAGGMGSLLVQLAKAEGGRVFAAASTAVVAGSGRCRTP